MVNSKMKGARLAFSSCEAHLVDERARKNAQMAPFNSNLVGEKGLEPLRPEGHKILSLARLPVPPLARGIIIS